MEKKSFLKIGGAMLLMAIVLNIQYAWGDYGVKDNPLHLEVLAQGNDTGDQVKAAGEGSLWVKSSSNCRVSARGTAGGTVTIFGVKFEAKANGDASLTVYNAETSCANGGNEQCSSLSCGSFWIQYVQANGTPAAK